MGRKGGFYVRIVKSTGRRYMYDQVDVRASGRQSIFCASITWREGETIQVIRKLRDSLI